jgi:hypothetical protein
MKHKYKNNILWWFPQEQLTTDDTTALKYSSEGIPFFGNKTEKSQRLVNPMSGHYFVTTDEYIKTDYQYDFQPGDKISYTPNPSDSVDSSDFNLIDEVKPIPIRQKGNKYRTKPIYDFIIKLT